ncbi:MAG: hypothetical protein PHC51_08125 [bacterium]|nr:hypothetical protein [bacterium]
MNSIFPVTMYLKYLPPIGQIYRALHEHKPATEDVDFLSGIFDYSFSAEVIPVLEILDEGGNIVADIFPSAINVANSEISPELELEIIADGRLICCIAKIDGCLAAHVTVADGVCLIKQPVGQADGEGEAAVVEFVVHMYGLELNNYWLPSGTGHVPVLGYFMGSLNYFHALRENALQSAEKINQCAGELVAMLNFLGLHDVNSEMPEVFTEAGVSWKQGADDDGTMADNLVINREQGAISLRLDHHLRRIRIKFGNAGDLLIHFVKSDGKLQLHYSRLELGFQRSLHRAML